MPRRHKERRRHARFELPCPVTVTDAGGTVLLQTRTLNVSDGGALLRPARKAIELGQDVSVLLRVPRSTPNTFLYEEVASGARVVRHQRLASATGLAVMFARPLRLELEAEPERPTPKRGDRQERGEQLDGRA
jgi:hypothetical protein